VLARDSNKVSALITGAITATHYRPARRSRSDTHENFLLLACDTCEIKIDARYATLIRILPFRDCELLRMKVTEIMASPVLLSAIH